MEHREKSTFAYNEEKGILTKKYFHQINIEDIESTWVQAFNSKSVPLGTKRFVLDYRDASFDLNPKDYIRIPEFYKKHVDIFSFAKIAVLTDNPKDLIIPILVEAKDKGFFSRPFSTMEAATSWLMV